MRRPYSKTDHGFEVSFYRRLKIKPDSRAVGEDPQAPFHSYIKERKKKTEKNKNTSATRVSFIQAICLPSVSLLSAQEFVVYFKAFESHCELIGYIHLKCYSRVYNSGSCTRLLICESKRIVLDS